MNEWLLLALGVLLTAGAAVFVAAEFSLVALDRTGVQRAVDGGDQRAATVLDSLRHLSTQLSAAQVGITLTTLLVGYLVEPSLGTLLVAPLEALGLPAEVVRTGSTALALVVATVFSMVIGEITPQFLGISAPLATAKVVAGPVRFFSIVARPLVVVLNGSANAFLRWVGVEPQEELSGARTPQELSSMVRRSAEAGTLDEDTARLLTRTLSFGERTADDVMTPRVRVTTIERTASAYDVLTLARRTGHSRFPVTGEDFDDIDGVVHVKRALAVPHDRRRDVPVSALMADTLYVPETIRLDPLLLQLRESGFQLAIVLDEYGGTSGVVTLEDVVEEIVGEVADEHDRGDRMARTRADGSWSLPGLWRCDEVRDRLGAAIPEGSAYETVGGFVMAQLGRIPVVGDVVTFDGWSLTVEGMEGRRVDRLRLTRAASDPVDGPDAAEDGERR
ncbi:hemolysin family protein [Arsenicicoccus piscis]|uniref:Membrane protein n=1 Tax=Arsenicicoccus piscis TaxID=673954 RepID=A0ABQ6HLE6_9MICO|nr:hemolysin family protein [Arsenicicoccus piscis]MCH8628271.1 hemolysin family protein [Arsenicicoccus piscis]GMA18524.1 membrane protein [Arsenicicoccus piscis]